MRRDTLFVAASLGCLVISGIALATPQALAVSSWPPFEKVICANLVNSYYDSGTRPEYGTLEYKRYAECYYITCGTQLSW